MISAEKISTYIKAPESIDFKDLSELESLIAKYPYSATIHTLYLKALALANHLDFEPALKNTAAHTHDRAHLYSIINSSTPSEKAVETEEKVETITEVVLEEEVLPTEQPSASIVQLEKESTPTVVNTVNTEEEELIEESKEESEDNDVHDPLEIDILNQVIDIAYVHSGISTEATNSKTEEQPEEEEQMTSPPELTPEIDLEKSQPNPETEIVQEEKAKPVEKTSEKALSFVEWLKAKQNSPVDDTEEKQVERPEEKQEEKPENEKKEVAKTSINALLDKFIEEEPSISRPVKDFYNPAKNAKKSLEESDDLVSETLAKIYLLQKNYKKAIAAYNQLILLYPEKKTFFASQIEKINNELK